jgi:hypothetical protein
MALLGTRARRRPTAEVAVEDRAQETIDRLSHLTDRLQTTTDALEHLVRTLKDRIEEATE